MLRCVITAVLLISTLQESSHALRSKTSVEKRVRRLIRSWAPLVWLAPGEEFLPLGVPEFLDNVEAVNDGDFLSTRLDVERLLRNKTSFLYGKKPWMDSVPVYALVENCALLYNTSGDHRQTKKEAFRKSEINTKEIVAKTGHDEDNGVDREVEESLIYEEKRTRLPHFHVTYWMFYPFSEGKTICVLDLGYLGSWPIPLVGGKCFGLFKEYGSHVGDWEHMSLFFKGDDHPLAMYVSAHDAGAFYRYDPVEKDFVYEAQETRKGIFQKPIFPDYVYTAGGSHPVLFSAKGSHGLWTAPGKHKFVRLPRLYDESGFGSPWPTWRKVEMLPRERRDALPSWMNYKGRWGNPKTNCHPLAKLGINFCQFVDGPTGIPLKKFNFHC
ncbi:uncharacterized protein LOC124184710 [Neodiprion fabricii]|uniref:uncharacterized protein LOC124184710 n=1 Tax=Neodiprion fabricii TaxID=2872261 RepID=UPI001ED92DAD|nr:uncharacterized protein LOC124184710 [Neodiprion fabricii]XP_046430686.1 uncharacterized protein LOC124184710 [Neodiprion fabricii]